MSARMPCDRARRRLVAMIAAIVVAPAARSQPKAKHRLGILAIGTPQMLFDGERDKLLGALADLGYRRGDNLEVDEHYATTSEGLDEVARRLAASGADVIVTEGTVATLAVQKATDTIPIVTHVGDPVAAGFARTLQRPGGNITGMSQNRGELAVKTIELLRLLRPGLTAVATAFQEPYPGIDILLRPLIDASRGAHLAVHSFSYRPGEFDKVFEELKAQRIGALILMPGASGTRVIDRRRAIAALRQKVALMAQQTQDVEQGALASVENDGRGDTVHLAGLIDKILRGARPGEIPFAVATRFRTTVNAKTAAALGIRLTPEITLRVDRIVE